MFTIYIHILEVCAMNIDGASMVTIGNMGSCFSMPDIQRGVRALEKEGFITRERVIDGRVYKITDKALEYCDTITRKREFAENEKMAKEVSEGVLKNPIAPTQDAITAVSENPSPLNVMGGKVSMSLLENETIDELVKLYEGVSNVRVVRATLCDDLVTMSYEPIPDVNTDLEPEECYECGGSCNYHEDWCPYNYA